MISTKRFLLALAMMVGCGCAEPEHAKTDQGGRIWSLQEVIDEGAEDGAGVEPADICEDCCFPGVCTIFCCGEGGGSGAGGGGGDLCSSRCSNYAACGANFTYCNKYCGGCPA